MTRSRVAALFIAVALTLAGCSGTGTPQTPAPSTTAAVVQVQVPTVEPTTSSAPTTSATTTTTPAAVSKAVLDDLYAQCAAGKVTGSASEVYDTCYCVGALLTSGGSMAGQMPDGRAVADTCPALVVKARR